MPRQVKKPSVYFSSTTTGVTSVLIDYPAVDSNQSLCYNASTNIACPSTSAAFYGQDAQTNGSQPSYINNGNGTVTDIVTGLTWQQTADRDGNGTINTTDKLSLSNAQSYCSTLVQGGYDDWRLPSIKELYSLILFTGTDPSGLVGTDTSHLTPFINTTYFNFGYGDTKAGERVIDAQYWSNTSYVSMTMHGDTTQFGVNFADGRIKGYPKTLASTGAANTEYVKCVRGNSEYGQNNFVDNGNGTISDKTTGLMWMQSDAGQLKNWQDALAWAAQQNAANYLGHSDWRLPNAKELQTLVDYTRSPSTTNSAAINPLFSTTSIVNEAGQTDYPYFWTSTTHADYTGNGSYAVYIAFGRAMGNMPPTAQSICGASGSSWLDVHGAGAQRSDPKSAAQAPTNYSNGHGLQCDAIHINNAIRLVRNIS
jgi:hypothetical protein